VVYRHLNKVIERCGVIPAMIVFSLLRGTAVICLAGNKLYIFWLLGIFCYGAATSMLLILVQTWLNIIAQGPTKGWVIGLYSSALSSGIAIGPVLLHILPLSEQNHSYLSGGIALVPMLLLLIIGKTAVPIDAQSQVRMPFTFRYAKPAMVAAFVGGISFLGLPSFLSLYGVENGLSRQQASLLMTMFMLGSVLVGFLISAISARLHQLHLVLFCVFGSLVCAVFLSLSVYAHYNAALGLLFVWGGFMGGVYAIGLSMVSESFRYEDQVSANVSYTLMDSFGGILGLMVIGLCMDQLGAEGLPYVLVIAGSGLLVFLVRQSVKDIGA
jgi:MFS family permease